jgi:CRISPR-associated protein Cas2
MTVLVANDVPPAIRGHLKRWFIEPRPNVFVGTLNPRTHRKGLDFITRNAPPDFGFISISSDNNCQGFSIERHGPRGVSGFQNINLSGIQLPAPTYIDPDLRPF